MKKLFASLAFLFAAVASAQGPGNTPNLRFQVPGFGQDNWQVQYNYNTYQLDLLLSGKAPIPGLNVTGRFNAPSAQINGTLNEALFSGSSVAARVLSACNTLPSGTFAVVLIPPTELATDTGFTSVPGSCVIQDQRGLIFPNAAGAYNVGNGTNNIGGQLFWRQVYTSSSSSAATTNPLVQQLHLEPQAGGYNNFVSAGNGQKTNYVNQYLTQVSRTPGQHNLIEAAQNCYSNGDCYPLLFLPNCYGQQTANGDEGCEAMTGVVTAGFPALTATVTAINGSTLTMSCGTNCEQLGEQQPLLVSSRATYTTGTIAAISGNPPVIVGSGTSWASLCPGGTTPCSPSNLFFEFTAETANNVHVIMPVTTITDNTHITLFLQATLLNQPWIGYTTSGNYTLYTGSTIATTPTAGVPYTGGSYSTIYAVVVDPTQYQVGDSILGPGAPEETTRVLHAGIAANVPSTSNPGSNLMYLISNGRYPISNGLEVLGTGTGGWSGSGLLLQWPTATVPGYGVRLLGPNPGVSFYFANDPVNNNLEKIIGTNTSGGSNFDYISYDRTGGNNRWQLANLFLTGSATIPTLNGNTSVGGAIYNSAAGVMGTYQNLLKYSQFDSASIGSTWVTQTGSAAPASITSNTTAVTDPNGGNTAEAVVMPSSFGASSASGQQQSVTLTSGLPYTAGVCFRGAVGGEQVAYGLALSPYDVALTLTTSWQCVSFTATPSGTVSPGFFWNGQTPSATIYVAFAQLEQAQGKGYYVHTTSSAFAATSGALVNSFVDTALTPGTAPVCPNGTNGALTNSGCATSGGVSTITATAPLQASASSGNVAMSCPTCSAGTTISSSSDVANTNFTSEQLLCSLTIPAGTLSGTQDAVNSRMSFHASVTTSGSGNMTIALNLNTANSFSGITRLALPSAASAAGRTYIIDGQCHTRGSASMICDATIQNSTNFLTTNALASTSFAVGSPIYFVVSGTQTTSTDTTTCREMQARVY